MRPIKRFLRNLNKTFRKQTTSGKAVIGCLSLIVICFLCSIPAGLLSQTPTPAPQATFTSPAAQTATYTPSPSQIDTQAPPVSLSFTDTFLPSQLPSFTPSFTISPLPPSGPLRVHFVDVGQGDSILIQTPNGQTILIDGGETNTGIVQYLQSLGIQRIDLMIATHPHSDHIGGLVQVLHAFPVAKVATNGELYTTSVYENFLDAITAAQADYIELKRGDILSQGGIDFHCLNPLAPDNPDPNENSLVLQFTYGKTTFLLMGDAGSPTESSLLAAGLLSKVDILKVGHHGSNSGTSSAFLDVIRPTVAIYSAGLNNSYGFPTFHTISVLQAIGATIYGTDQSGTILVTADLNGYTVKPARLTSAPIPTLKTALPLSAALTISSVTSPVSQGANATLTAQTAPNASCTITVSYKSGPSHASGLGPQTASASGVVSWTWKVGSTTTYG